MKKIILAFTCICFLLTALCACGQSSSNAQPSAATGDKISVVSTIFAPYDFVRQIAGDNIDVSMLLPPGSESHSFEPTPQDIIKIQNCDVFIYVGGDSDAWMQRVLDSMDTSNMEIIALMDCVEVVEEEIVEGMEDDHGHSHEHEEFDPANVKDRPMSDFSGEWISGIPLINDGSLDEYIHHNAEEKGVSEKERKAELLIRWESDYDNIAVEDNTLTINGSSAKYDYKGYRIIESDYGATVWYSYQIAEPVADMPVYITFSDHGYGAEEHHDEHTEEHETEHEHEEIGHFHMKYGNESFDILIDNEAWEPFYFDASHSNAEIGEFMAGHGEEAEFDEHVWTSPKNTKLIVQKISDVFSELDRENTEVYKENTADYLAKLDELDAKFQEIANSAVRKTLIFGDRFPFRYFADCYSLDYYAAFPGCSTETEASAATVAFLIDKIKEAEIPVVFHAEMSNKKMANTISEETGAKVLLFHACHNVTKDEMADGVTYIDLMNQNAENLKEALN